MQIIGDCFHSVNVYLSPKVITLSGFHCITNSFQGDSLRMHLLIRYFAKVPLPTMPTVTTITMPIVHGPGEEDPFNCSTL